MCPLELGGMFSEAALGCSRSEGLDLECYRCCKIMALLL